MNAELKAKWVKALLSGKYKQGAGYLRNTDGTYCCLGVLRDVIEPGSDKASEDWGYLHSSHRCGLGRATQIALGLLNDDAVPFDVIAGLIAEAMPVGEQGEESPRG